MARSQVVVLKLERRIGYLEPTNVDALEQIIWKGRHLGSVNHEVTDLVAPEASNCLP